MRCISNTLFPGSRTLRSPLLAQVSMTDRLAVAKLMRRMEIEAWRRLLNMSGLPAGHKICPYPLRRPVEPKQFTSVGFTGLLQEQKIAISMDGRAAWPDNVFVERLYLDFSQHPPAAFEPWAPGRRFRPSAISGGEMILLPKP